MRIGLLHTGAIHAPTFDELFKARAPGVILEHRIHENLLDRAREKGTDDIRDDTRRILKDMADADAVLCTCSSLGEMADEIAKAGGNVVRIDRPLMEAACNDGRNILVVICLESTRAATLGLLEECASDLGCEIAPRVLLCSKAWPHFEAGDLEGYATEIAKDVKAALADWPEAQSVILAQASMRVAEDKLTDCGLPIRTSPVLAVERALEMARKG